ncbi:MAG: hypothetical protein WCW13_06545 [archaeon]|jgi:hypothetical protein
MKIINKPIILILLLLILSTVFSTAPTGVSIAIKDSTGSDTELTKTSDLNFVISASGDTNAMCFSKSASACTSLSDYTIDYSTNVTLAQTGISLSDGNNQIFVFIKDSNSEILESSSSSDWVVYDATAPTITASPPDGNSFNSGSINIDVNITDLGAGVKQASILVKVDGVTNGTPAAITNGYRVQFTTSGLSEGDHNYTIDANDLLDNKATTVSRTFTVDTNAPTNGSVSFSGWTNSDKPTLTVTKTHLGNASVLMRFSCTSSSGDTNWSTWTTFASTYSDFNINSSTYGCSPSDWNKTIYMKLKDSAGNIDSNTYFGTVFYDNTSPSAPTDLAASAGNAKVSLTWTVPVADNRSGNSRVEIYKNGTLYGDINYGTTSYDVTGLTNGAQSTFKVRTKDLAGNYSSFTEVVTATPQATAADILVTRNNSTAAYAKNGDALNIECSFSPSANGAHIYYQFYNPTTSNSVLKESSSSVSSLSETFTLNTTTNYEKVGFWCEAIGSAGSGISYVTIDNVLPTLSWADTNNTFIGVKKILVTASDNKALTRVDLNFKNVIYSTTKDTGNNYYNDFNTTPFENGSYQLIAMAYDAVGNKATITKTITIDNILTIKQKAEKMISDAKEKQKTSNDIINLFKRESLIVPVILSDKKKNADTLLTESESLLATNFDSALSKSTQANDLFDEFNKTVKIDSNITKSYEYDKNSLTSELVKLGLTEQQASIAQQTIKTSNIQRKLTIVKAGDENKRQVKIEISFTNDTNETVLKIIEMIPKELVNSAKKIISDANYRIVQDDPIIEFTVPVKKGAKATFSYGIGEISTTKANEIIDANVIALFNSPPIIISQKTRAEEFIANSISLDSTQALIIGLIIIIILSIIGVLFLIKFKKPGQGHGFGEEKTLVEHLTPETPPEKPKWSAP